MTNVRPGYWDVERCTWVGAEPTHVAPPVPASARDICDDTDAPDAVPAPRADVEVSAAVAADSRVG